MSLAFGVFIHREDSIYRDTPAERYHFPRQYLNRVNACIGDWILYYEPRRVHATRGYFAAAHVQTVVDDESTSGMYFAQITPGSYIDFPRPVPFSSDGVPAERGLLNDVGAISGRAQSAVRPITPEDFSRIIRIGLNEVDLVLPRVDAHEFANSGFEEAAPQFILAEPRGRTDIITSRIVRDRAFRALILGAYDERCALTGLKLINGGGRAEANAAHIMPVEKNGPDSISNGLALSGTAHWMSISSYRGRSTTSKVHGRS